MPSAKKFRHSGVWLLIDNHGGLIFLGKDLFSGQSPSNHGDIFVRRVLTARMRDAVRDRGSREATAGFDDRNWTTKVIPILGPRSGRVLAVLGAYCDSADAEALVPPVVGAWEYPAAFTAEEEPMPSFGTNEEFRLYGLSPDSAMRNRTGQRYLPVPQLMTEVVHEEDRHSTLAVLDRFHTDETGSLTEHRYRAHTDSGSGAIRHLRLVGRRDTVDSLPREHTPWVRGITHRITEAQYRAGGPSLTMEMLNAAVSLGPAYLVVDPARQRIALTTKKFVNLGVHIPTDRCLSGLCHPDDFPTLLTTLDKAALARPSAEVDAPGAVRLKTREGTWLSARIAVTAMALSNSRRPPYLYCRVLPNAS
ncbi:MAG TPA: hypothetical protein VG247_29420 [Pseudonocardiaceae bacterium]|nr:hypothetical protein [Pseudonocardiaceae bacterium]